MDVNDFLTSLESFSAPSIQHLASTSIDNDDEPSVKRRKTERKRDKNHLQQHSKDDGEEPITVVPSEATKVEGKVPRFKTSVPVKKEDLGAGNNNDSEPESDQGSEDDLYDSDDDLSNDDVDGDSFLDSDEEDLDHKSDRYKERLNKLRQIIDSAASEKAGHELPLAEPPATFKVAMLKSFQLQGLGWMMNRERMRNASDDCCGGILSDHMGLGKTRTTIALVEATRPNENTSPCNQAREVTFSRIRSLATLIVCPVSVLGYWAREVREVVSPKRTILRYHGANRRSTKKSRRSLTIFSMAHSTDYVLTSYQTLARELQTDGATSPLAMIDWFRIVLDEGHIIRNPKSKLSKACLALCGSRRWIISGTPLQNRVEDLQPLFGFLKIPYFGNCEWFERNIASYCNIATSEQQQEEGTALPPPLRSLKVLVDAVLLRRTPETKLPDGQPILQLPKKTIKTICHDLEAEERLLHDGLKKNAAVKLEALQGHGAKLMTYACAFEMLIRCRQACLHPYIVLRALKEKRKREGGSLDGDQAAIAHLVTAEEKAAEAAARQEETFKAEIERFVKVMTKRTEKALASSTAFSHQVLDEIAQNKGQVTSECVICMDEMRDPCLLPCAHMFCEECLKASLNAFKRCPVCKRPAKEKDIATVPKKASDKSQTDGNNDDDVSPLGDAALAAFQVPPEAEWKDSGKLLRILAILEEHKGESFIIFSQFVTFLTYLQAALRAKRGQDVPIYSGQLSVKRRDALQAAFQCSANGSGLLVSIGAGSVGVTLSKASVAIFCDPNWNPAVTAQATDRIYRIGQERDVTIYHLVASDSIEAAVSALAANKAALASSLVGKRGSGLKREELMNLFKKN